MPCQTDSGMVFHDMAAYHIVRARPDRDARDICKLIEACRSERTTIFDGYTVDEERGYLESLGPCQAVFVALDDDTFSGFASIAPRWPYSQRLSHCGEFGTWVEHRQRRRGVGRALWLDGILPFCHDNGLSSLGSMLMAHNSAALAFYEGLGFRICGYRLRLVEWDGERLDAFEIEAQLEDIVHKL